MFFKIRENFTINGMPKFLHILKGFEICETSYAFFACNNTHLEDFCRGFLKVCMQ
jgi:hypothetical protein